MPGGQALDGTRQTSFLMAPDDLVIVRDPGHWLYRPEADLPVSENMVAAMLALGCPDELLVVKEEYEGRVQTLIVDGRQRQKAACEAKRRMIASGLPPLRLKCALLKGDHKRLAALATSLNEIRRVTSPLEKAADLQRILGWGYSEEEAGVIFGVSRTAVKAWLKLLDLTQVVRDAVGAGKISSSAAAELHGLSADEQKAKLEELLASGATSTRAVREAREGLVPAKKHARAGVPKSRLKRLYKIMSDGEGEVEDRGAILLLGWLLGADGIAEDDVKRALKGFAATLRTEGEKAAKRRAKATAEV